MSGDGPPTSSQSSPTAQQPLRRPRHRHSSSLPLNSQLSSASDSESLNSLANAEVTLAERPAVVRRSTLHSYYTSNAFNNANSSISSPTGAVNSRNDFALLEIPGRSSTSCSRSRSTNSNAHSTNSASPTTNSMSSMQTQSSSEASSSQRIKNLVRSISKRVVQTSGDDLPPFTSSPHFLPLKLSNVNSGSQISISSPQHSSFASTKRQLRSEAMDIILFSEEDGEEECVTQIASGNGAFPAANTLKRPNPENTKPLLLAGDSLGLFPPNHILRISCWRILSSPIFEPTILLLIMINWLMYAVQYYESNAFRLKSNSWADWIIFGIFVVYTYAFLFRLMREANVADLLQD